jgi:hypothetical protein
LKKLGLLKQGDLSGKVVVILTLSYLGLDWREGLVRILVGINIGLGKKLTLLLIELTSLNYYFVSTDFFILVRLVLILLGLYYL